jgi:DNA-binding transcriptional MerR regulator
MSIGEVLAELRPEFPDVTISKIRFLEEQGLVEPARTPAGYRKFTHADLERLRYVLGLQRDHYLPLRVIREQLAGRDQGIEPAPLPGRVPGGPRLVTPAGSAEGPPRELRLTRDEVIESSGISRELLAALESYGLVTPRIGAQPYDGEAIGIARAAAQLSAYGVEPRHLRAFRTAADREAGLVEQVIAPLRRQRGPEAAARAEETAREMAALCVSLHAALVRSTLDRGAG